MPPDITLICDLQYGSTGKGLLAGYLATKDGPDAVATAWMPNAGHTFIDSDGTKYVHTMLANGIISPSVRKVFIGPGSVINVDSLMDEISPFESDLSRNFEVFIHPNAAVVNEGHREAEKAFVKIGSTMKGSAAAVIQKLRRDPENMNTALAMKLNHSPFRDKVGPWVRSINEYNNAMDSCRRILVEGAQGYSLGVHQRFYPYCTSRECTPAQIMTDCGIPPYDSSYTLWGCLRTFPIRVANRVDGNGNQVGTSGPCYQDQFELSWDSLGIEPELTTVTQLRRRIFTFSMMQLRDALRGTGCTNLFLNFMNYLPTDQAREDFVRIVQYIASDYGASVCLLGHGATVDDIEGNPYAS